MPGNKNVSEPSDAAASGSESSPVGARNMIPFKVTRGAVYEGGAGAFCAAPILAGAAKMSPFAWKACW